MISILHATISAILFVTGSTQLFSESTDVVNVQDFRNNDDQLTSLSHSRNACEFPFSYWLGKCLFKYSKDVCLCSEKYYATSGICKRIRWLCKRSFNCSPGNCILIVYRDVYYSKSMRIECFCTPGYFSYREVCKEIVPKCYNSNCTPGICSSDQKVGKCLCPQGYTAQNGSCIEIEPKCFNSNCTPGICSSHRKVEACLCPQGYTAQNGSCIEITLKGSEKASVIMMMVIVAAASAILTTFFGICTCYYFRQRTE